MRVCSVLSMSRYNHKLRTPLLIYASVPHIYVSLQLTHFHLRTPQITFSIWHAHFQASPLSPTHCTLTLYSTYSQIFATPSKIPQLTVITRSHFFTWLRETLNEIKIRWNRDIVGIRRDYERKGLWDWTERHEREKVRSHASGMRGRKGAAGVTGPFFTALIRDSCQCEGRPTGRVGEGWGEGWARRRTVRVYLVELEIVYFFNRVESTGEMRWTGCWVASTFHSAPGLLEHV